MNTPPSTITSGLRMSIVYARMVASLAALSLNTRVQNGSPSRTCAKMSFVVSSPVRACAAVALPSNSISHSRARMPARRAMPAPEQNPSALPSLL